jgi:hypothetical protein
VGYGNAPPPEGAPVAPPDLIGASLFLGLVSVLSISRHGAYLIALALGHVPFDAVATAVMLLNIAGFVASLWFLALRRWAWALGIGYAAVETGLRFYLAVSNLEAAAGPHVLAAAGEAFLGLVFLVVLAYMAGGDTRALIRARVEYRAAQQT